MYHLGACMDMPSGNTFDPQQLILMQPKRGKTLNFMEPYFLVKNLLIMINCKKCKNCCIITDYCKFITEGYCLLTLLSSTDHHI